MGTDRRPVVIRVLDELASARRGPVVALSAMLVLLVGVANYTTGSDLAFAAFYLPPILMVSATGVRAPLFAIPVLAATSWRVAAV